MNSKELKSIIGIVLIPTLAVIVSLLFGLIDKKSIVIGVFLIIIIIIATGLIVYLLTSSIISNLILRDDRLVFVHSKLEKLIMNTEQHPNIVTYSEVQRCERGAKEVWIITPDFYWDFIDEEISQLVKTYTESNKEKNYTYVYPVSLQHIADAMKHKFSSQPVKFYPIPDSQFMLLHYEIAIYDPNDIYSSYHAGFIADIPHYRDNSKTFHIKLDSKHALPSYINVFKTLCKNG